MQIRAINSGCYNKTAFQAKVPDKIKNKVLTAAVELGSDGLNKAKTQASNVEKWGRPDTRLELAVDFNSNTEHLGISNPSISLNYGAGFENQSGTLLDKFMRIKESDIIKAENKILEEVEYSKNDLMAKALKDQKLMKKITGDVNSTREDLAKSIDKLSEDEIVNLRFNLDDDSRFPEGPVLNFDFSN